MWVDDNSAPSPSSGLVVRGAAQVETSFNKFSGQTFK